VPAFKKANAFIRLLAPPVWLVFCLYKQSKALNKLGGCGGMGGRNGVLRGIACSLYPPLAAGPLTPEP